jgi:hypothetical protein
MLSTFIVQYHFLMIILLGVYLFLTIGDVKSTCVCDTPSGSRRLSEQPPGRTVEFLEAEIKGEGFIRTLQASVPRMPIELMGGYCDAEQIHINFGAELNSMVISYVSQSLFTESSVTYSTRISDITVNQNATVVHGLNEAYSELMYLTVRITITYLKMFEPYNDTSIS